MECLHIDWHIDYLLYSSIVGGRHTKKKKKNKTKQNKTKQNKTKTKTSECAKFVLQALDL